MTEQTGSFNTPATAPGPLVWTFGLVVCRWYVPYSRAGDRNSIPGLNEECDIGDPHKEHHTQPSDSRQEQEFGVM